MTKFLLEIDCDNDAFSPDPSDEISRILSSAASSIAAFRVAVGDSSARLRDVNGNGVGSYRLVAE